MTTPSNGGAVKKRKFPLISSDWGTDMVTVKVGEGKEEHSFLFHKNILCLASPYFNGAFNGKFIESAGIATLKYHEPSVFEVFHQWVYSNRVMRTEELRETSESMKNMLKDGQGQALFWIRVFKLADQMMVREIKVEAYDGIRQAFRAGDTELMPNTAQIGEVIDAAAPQILLEKFLSAIAAWHIVFGDIGKPEDREEDWKGYPEYSLMVLKQVMILSARRGICKRESSMLNPVRSPDYRTLPMAEIKFSTNSA